MKILKKMLCAAAVAGLLAVPFSAAHAWGNNWTPWGGNNGWGECYGSGGCYGAGPYGAPPQAAPAAPAAGGGQ